MSALPLLGCGDGVIGRRIVSTAEIYLDRAWTTRHIERPMVGPVFDLRPLRHRDPPPRAAVIEPVTVAAPDSKPLMRKRWPHWTVALSVSLHAAVALAALVLPASPPVLLDGGVTVEVVGSEMDAGLPPTGPQSAEPGPPIRRLAERALPADSALPVAEPYPEMPQPVAIDQTALQARPSPQPPLPEPIVEQTLPPAPIIEPVPAPEPEPLPPEPEIVPEPVPATPKPVPPKPVPPKAALPKPKPVTLTPAVPRAAQPIAAAATAPSAAAAAVAHAAASTTASAATASGHDQTPAVALRPAAAAGSGASRGERGASLIHKPSITYPRRAQRRGLEGVVEIRMVIGADGQPTAVSLEKSSGVRDLDDAGLAAAWLYRFQPALRGGIAVPWEFVQPIEFKLHAAR
jgi:periplasmic protein TonB